MDLELLNKQFPWQSEFIIWIVKLVHAKQNVRTQNDRIIYGLFS
jgi:hypothetical protein